jgi:hypothetical protein
LQESQIDFRALIKFKESLFQGTKISTDNKISEEEFKRIRAASDLSQIKNNICETEDIILAEVSKNGEVDLNSFCDLVDLYTYLPRKKSKYASGSLSPNIFRVLSSNVQDRASATD